MPTDLRDRAERAVERLESSLPQVDGICLFGSVARADSHESSDIDLLVVGRRRDITSAQVRRLASDPLVSATYHTPESLQRHMAKWSRFGVHLRDEGLLLVDPAGTVGDLFGEVRVETKPDEILHERRQLGHLDDLDRFGGQYLFPLSRLYSVGRTIAYALLAENGSFVFNPDQAFGELAETHPEAAGDISEVAGLSAFFYTTQGRPNVSLPFPAEGCRERVAAARAAAGRLAQLSRYS
jgi:predicted nucleotidyltransferase